VFFDEVAKKVWWKSKTIIAAVLFAGVGLLDIVGTVDLKAIVMLLGVSEAKVPGVIALLTIIFAWLRALTTKPIGKPEE
jgi:hypothetical protein